MTIKFDIWQENVICSPLYAPIVHSLFTLLWLVHMWLSKQDKFLRRTLIAMDHKISDVAPYCVLPFTLDFLSSKRDIGIIVHLEKSVPNLRQDIGMLMIGDGLTSTKD